MFVLVNDSYVINITLGLTLWSPHLSPNWEWVKFVFLRSFAGFWTGILRFIFSREHNPQLFHGVPIPGSCWWLYAFSWEVRGWVGRWWGRFAVNLPPALLPPHHPYLVQMWGDQEHVGVLWGLDPLLSWLLGQLHSSERLLQKGLWAAGRGLGALTYPILTDHYGKASLNILTSTFGVLWLLYFYVFTLDASTSLVWILHLLLHPRSAWGSWTAQGQVQNFGFPGRSAITGENRDVGCSGCDSYCTDLKHCSPQLCLPLQPNPLARHSGTLESSWSDCWCAGQCCSHWILLAAADHGEVFSYFWHLGKAEESVEQELTGTSLLTSQKWQFSLESKRLASDNLILPRMTEIIES